MKFVINKFHFQKLDLENCIWSVLEQIVLGKGKLADGKLSGFVFISLFSFHLRMWAEARAGIPIELGNS